MAKRTEEEQAFDHLLRAAILLHRSHPDLSKRVGEIEDELNHRIGSKLPSLNLSTIVEAMENLPEDATIQDVEKIK